MKLKVRVLSTKTLTFQQKKMLLKAPVSLIEADFIDIEHLPLDINTTIENAIFTSKNAVLSFLKNPIAFSQCFCVGTAASNLISPISKPILVSKTSTELANQIVKLYPKKKFTFFCGNKRLDTIPKALKNNNIKFKEHIIYNTHLTPKAVKPFFHAVLFFSPSAVQSFVKKHHLKNKYAFCIGDTTAKEAKKHGSNIIIAETPNVEQTLLKLIDFYTHHD